jgi:hypothetical protein
LKTQKRTVKGEGAGLPLFVLPPAVRPDTWAPVNEVAGEEGFEPPLTDPESAVLPLDDSPTKLEL